MRPGWSVSNGHFSLCREPILPTPTLTPLANPGRIGRRRLLLAPLAAACAGGLTAPGARAATSSGVSGLWTSSAGDYLVFLHDTGTGTSFALQVPGSFDTIRVWAGSGSATALSLQSLANPSDTLVLSVAGSNMSGTLTLAGAPQPFSASLALAWVASEYAGVWQKAGATHAYLVFCVLNTGSGRLGVQIDLSIQADKSYAYAIYTGALNDKQFNGVSITGSGQSSRLEFSGSSLSGSTTTLGRPPQTTSFTATQIIQIAA